MSSENVFLKDGTSVAALEEKIGYTFRDRLLLRQALTHLSYAHEEKTGANDGLAVLGDSLVNALATWHLFQRKPNTTSGELTEERKSYVSQYALVRLAQVFGLEAFLLLGKGEMRASPRMLADTFESLVGALFVDGGFEALAPFLERAFREVEMGS